jgi:hypothetical protein
VGKYIFLFFFLFNVLAASAQNKYTINGYVRDSLNRETLIGASLQVRELSRGVSTNQYGYFSITLPEGEYTIVVSFVGYFPFEQKIKLNGDQELNFSLFSK